MPRALIEPVALLLLAATLAFAVVRPRGLPEVVVAIPAALLCLVLGILPAQVALEELRSLAPTIGFLAAVLVLAELCDREGLFEAAGRRMAAGARGRPLALLGLVFLIGSAGLEDGAKIGLSSAQKAPRPTGIEHCPREG